MALGLAAVACDPSGGEGGNPFGTRFLEQEPALYSQGREEVFVRHFFRDRRAGFFLDIGAYHWQKYSTTLYLEEKLEWRGIAVDANRGFGPGYRENRPKTRFVSFLVGDRDDELATLFIEPASPGTASADRARVERAHELYAGPDAVADVHELQVRAITIDTLLDRAKVREIDFLSMDIEGHEVAALRGFDIERFRPELVCIEVARDNIGVVEDWFEARGYERLALYSDLDEANTYFAPVVR